MRRCLQTRKTVWRSELGSNVYTIGIDDWNIWCIYVSKDGHIALVTVSEL